MPNHMKFCSCTQCRAGRSAPRHQTLIRKAIRRFRQQAKRILRRGDDDGPDTKFGVPYTG